MIACAKIVCVKYLIDYEVYARELYSPIFCQLGILPMVVKAIIERSMQILAH